MNEVPNMDQWLATRAMEARLYELYVERDLVDRAITVITALKAIEDSRAARSASGDT